MIKEEQLKEEFGSNKIGVFKLENLNEELIDKTMFLGNQTHKEFLAFVQFNNIKNIFYKYYYKDREDYFVDIDDIDIDIDIQEQVNMLEFLDKNGVPPTFPTKPTLRHKMDNTKNGRFRN